MKNPVKKPSWWDEFAAFAIKGNAMALAVGTIIGAAFSTITKSLTDDIIIPIKLDAFSLRGMGNLMRQIGNMRKINPRLKLAGVLPTMWYRDAQMQDAEKMLADAGLTVFPHIRRSDKVDRMTWQQRPLLATSPNSAAGVDYRRFVKAYMRGGQENV